MTSTGRLNAGGRPSSVKFLGSGEPPIYPSSQVRPPPKMPEAPDNAVSWQSYVDQQFRLQAHAVEIALAQLNTALGKTEDLQIERVESVRRETRNALDAATIAIVKSDAAAEKRFATIDELRKQITMADERAMSRVEAEQEFAIVRKALEGLESVKANEQLQQERMEGIRREAAALQQANSTAIAKSETSAEKRFESVNEFRAQLSSQAERFIPREVVEAQTMEFRAALAIVNSRLDQTQGAAVASARMTTIAIGVVGLIITVVVFLANFLTG